MSLALKNMVDKLHQEAMDRINQLLEATRQLEHRVESLEKKTEEKWTTLHLPRSSK